MTSLNTEWGKVQPKKSIHKKNSFIQFKSNQLSNIDEEERRVPLSDVNEIAKGQKIIKEDIEKLKKVLQSQKEHH